ncbi:mucin-2-like [Sycon ciliatum]|uniref:mucin-2-like n=1 Tax=Sycon ciliatum TaxID=27933 RepID=UPI0031F6FADD
MFVCPTGGYPGARHDNIRDLLAEVLVDVAQDVEQEPRLAAMHGEDLPGRQLNRQDEARADIRARGFWTRQQDAYFDVRVTHPEASVLSRSEVLGQLGSHERRKKAEYGPRIVNIERASFTPLVFTTQGLAAPECAKFLSTLATYLSRCHTDIPYSILINRLRVYGQFSTMHAHPFITFMTAINECMSTPCPSDTVCVNKSGAYTCVPMCQFDQSAAGCDLGGPDHQSGSESEGAVGAAVGGAVGGILVLAVVIALLVLYLKRRKKKKHVLSQNSSELTLVKGSEQIESQLQDECCYSVPEATNGPGRGKRISRNMFQTADRSFGKSPWAGPIYCEAGGEASVSLFPMVDADDLDDNPVDMMTRDLSRHAAEEAKEREESRQRAKDALSTQPTLETQESTFSLGSRYRKSGSAGDKMAATILYHDIGLASVEKNNPCYLPMAEVKEIATTETTSNPPTVMGESAYEEMAPSGKEEQDAIAAAVSPALMDASMCKDMASLGKKDEQDTSQVADPPSTNMYQPLGPAGATEQYQSVTPAQAERAPTQSMTSSKPTSTYEEPAPAGRIEQYETLTLDVQHKSMDNRTKSSTPMPDTTASMYQTVADGSQKEQYQSLTSDVRGSITKDSTSSTVSTTLAVYEDLNGMKKQGRYQSLTSDVRESITRDRISSTVSTTPAVYEDLKVTKKQGQYQSRTSDVRGSIPTDSTPSTVSTTLAVYEDLNVTKKQEQYQSLTSNVRGSIPTDGTSSNVSTALAVYEDLNVTKKQGQYQSPTSDVRGSTTTDSTPSTVSTTPAVYEDLNVTKKQGQYQSLTSIVRGSIPTDSTSSTLSTALAVYEDLNVTEKQEQYQSLTSIVRGSIPTDSTSSTLSTTPAVYEDLNVTKKQEQYQSLTSNVHGSIPTDGASSTVSAALAVYEDLNVTKNQGQYQSPTSDVRGSTTTDSTSTTVSTTPAVYEDLNVTKKQGQYQSLTSNVHGSIPTDGTSSTVSAALAVYEDLNVTKNQGQYQSPTSDVRGSTTTDSTSSTVSAALAVYEDLNVMKKQEQYQPLFPPRLRKPSDGQAGSSLPRMSGGASDRVARAAQHQQVSGKAQRTKYAQDTQKLRAVSLSQSATNKPSERSSAQGHASPANPGSAVYQALGTEPQEHLYESTTVPKPSNTKQAAGLPAEPTGDYQAILAAYVQTSDYEQPRKYEKSTS